MRKIDWEDYKKTRKTFIRNKARLGVEKVSSSRLRDPLEREILSRLDKNRWQKWFTTGKLKKIGQRNYLMNIG